MCRFTKTKPETWCRLNLSLRCNKGFRDTILADWQDLEEKCSAARVSFCETDSFSSIPVKSKTGSDAALQDFTQTKAKTSPQFAVLSLKWTNGIQTKTVSFGGRPPLSLHVTADEASTQADQTVVQSFKFAYPNSRWIATGAAILSAHTGSTSWEGGGRKWRSWTVFSYFFERRLGLRKPTESSLKIISLNIVRSLLISTASFISY